MDKQERLKINKQLNDSKICAKCNVEKKLIEYHKNNDKRDGYQYLCKECISEKQKSAEYQIKHNIRYNKYKEKELIQWKNNRIKKLQKTYSNNSKILKQELLNKGYKELKLNKLFYINEYGDLKKIPALGKLVNNKKHYINEVNEVNVKININGYKIFCMNGKEHRVHQIVAETYLNHIPKGNTFVVDHIDGNKINNHYKNLQIISNVQNLMKGMYSKTKNDKLLKHLNKIKL